MFIIYVALFNKLYRITLTFDLASVITIMYDCLFVISIQILNICMDYAIS